MTRLLVVLSCCASLWVSGCSDAPSPTSPSSPTAGSPSSAPTSEPTQARETPEEFVRRWVEVDREMQNSGETSEYRRLSADCQPCNALADQIESIYRAGGYVKTDGLAIRSIRVGKQDRNQEVEVRLHVRSTPTEYVEEANGPAKSFPGGIVTYLIALQPAGVSWVVTLLERLVQ